MAEFRFDYDVFPDMESMPEPFKPLLAKARACCLTAYAPYSGFNVGAAVLLENGSVIPGVNIENASYPVGICAERSALSAAISQFPDQKINAIAISYDTSSGAGIPVFPCGMCRQFLAECEDRNAAPIPVILSGQHGQVILIRSVLQLLPFHFSGTDLS
ncbi:MAG TPA: cytidine deaminase [Chitinophagaceae bacterium]|nr:cytidine deaminase [Chitinophagaceae bacterium]